MASINDEQPLFTLKDLSKKYDEVMPSDLPEKGTPEFNFLQTFCSKVEVILQTVNDNEYQAATTVLEKPDAMFDRAVVFPKNGVVLGMFAKKKTALIQTGMGTKARYSIAKAIETFPRARYVIGVGVCYAFDREKYELGDVLVSKKICDLENEKWDSPGKVEDRGQRVDVVESLQEIFCRNKVHNPKFEVSAKRTSKVYSGTFISHPSLIDNKEIRDKLLNAIPAAIGGEMEGGQLLQFQQEGDIKGIIVIKGVCDYADGNKAKEWQFISAWAALNYTKCKLLNEQSLIDEESPPQVSALPAQPRLSPAAECKPVKYMGKDAPTMQDLVTVFNKETGKKFNLAEKISNSWEDIGLILGIEHTALGNIKSENHKISERLREVFKLWLDDAAKLPNHDSYPLSWQGLETLLNICGKSEVAKQYFQFIDNMPEPQK